MAIKTRTLKELDLKELNSILENIYREINDIKSVLSSQDNKALSEPSGSIRVKRDGNSDDYFLEFKSKNGWISSSTATYKLKEN
tara:strand:- start:267 stop:518 length:252 start_codon:yes stop_codon:yes gene_type:complete